MIHYILRALPCKKAAQTADADILDYIFSVHASSRKGNRIRVQICGKDLHISAEIQLLHDLRKEDCDGIRLLTGGTARHPHTDLVCLLPVLHDVLDHPLLQHLEELGIPEEGGHTDQHLLGKRFCLLLIFLQILNIALKVPAVRYHDPPLDPAKDRRLLVIGVVRVRDALQNREYLRHQISVRQLHLPVGQIDRGGDMRHLLCDCVRPQNQVHEPRRNSVSRHAVKFCRLRILHDDHAVLLLDRPDAVGSVRSGSRHDHRDCPVLIRSCQRPEENINRMVDQGMVVLLQM